MTHTTGKWKVEHEADWISICTNQEDIARLEYYEGVDADASLIASAPALLEACKEALRWHTGDKWKNSKSKEEVQEWDRFNCKLEQAIKQSEG